MKKILLMIGILLSALLNLNAIDLWGPLTISQNERAYYDLNAVDYSQVVTIKWSWTQDKLRNVGGGYDGSSRIEMEPYNGVSGYAMISVTVYYENGYFEHTNLEIFIRPEDKVSLGGPNIAYFNQEVTYLATYSSLYDVKWKWDPDYFTFVSGDVNGSSIKLKPKNKLGTSYIKIMAYSKSSGELVDLYSHRVEVKDILYVMNPSTYSVNQNETVSYTLKSILGNSLPLGASVIWEVGKNMTLVSGQGTATATFKASATLFDAYGYATGIVKAKILYNNINYDAENSDVQIKQLPYTGSISYNAIKNYTDISRLDRVGSLTFGSEIRGATKFQWYGGFPVEYKGSKTSPIVTVDKKHIISKGFGMTIWVTASNDKESVTIYYFVSVDGVGGLDPTVE